jgi:hypothetical protein
MRLRFGLIAVLCLIVALGAARAQQEEKPQKTYPAQESVAAKGEFGKIAESDPAVKKALDAKNLEAAKKLVGKEGAFQGKVVKVFQSRNNSIVILNFARNYRAALVAALKPDDYAKFPKMDTLLDKRVLVQGKFVLYEERPEIELTKPTQIKIITAK